MERLIRLYEEFGQSPWLDNLKRGYLTSGQLAELRDGGIRGLTSNPTIFQKAIAGSADYDEQFREHRRRRRSGRRRLLGARHRRHRRRLRRVRPGVRRRATARDGFVSVEVAPGLAHDAAGTEAAARELHERIARRNLMVKIPATAAGRGADPADDQRGPQHQRHVDLQPRALPGGDGRLPRRPRGVRRRPTAPTCRRSPASPASSSPASTPRSTAGSRRSARRRRSALRGKAAVAQAQAGLPAVPRDVLRPALGGAGGSGRPGAAPAVGEHVDEEPGATRTRCTSTS